MPEPMKILRIIGTLDPKYGGPVKNLRDSIKSFGAKGYPCDVLTLDAPNAPWLTDYPARVFALGPSLGKYRYTPRLLPWLTRNANTYDAVIVSGIWQYQSMATWIASRKVNFLYYVYIHGALNPWFKHQYPLKHLKKWLYWFWAEYRVLRDARYVIYTSEEERRMASQSFWLYRANEKVVPYGIVSPPNKISEQIQEFYKAYPVLKNKEYYLFLGRLHLMKGIDLLLRSFAELSKIKPDLMLVIAGEGSEDYYQSLKKLAETLGLSQKVVWTGFLSGNIKWGAFRAANVFILPSHAENFGVTVAESLSCGTPVLISNKVNIWKEIEDNQAGMVAPDTPDGTLTLLREWFELEAEEQDRFRKNTIPCFNKHFEISASTEELIRVIRVT